ncbi:uncharacterized protein LOC143283859 [Babylonia areolata]|uniref:uncharacterized protein LOC143283859 n=1 Tax=Babylonia areolata TaxID=304850 RepID=UPI003FD60F50
MPKKRAFFCLFAVAILVICALDYLHFLLSAGLHVPFRFNERQRDSSQSLTKLPSDRGDVLLDRLSPRVQGSRETPGLVLPVVHYIWCGDKTFGFKDYLSVLSAIKTFHPLKLSFHHTHQPRQDDYNVWFEKLASETPGLEMHPLSPAPPCGSTRMLSTALDFLSESGGIFVGENTVLSPPALKALPVNTDLWFASSNSTSDSDRTNGLIVVARTGFNRSLKEAYLKRITSGDVVRPGCPPPGSFRPNDYCAVVPEVMYPRDVILAQTSFAELARLLFYGSQRPATPVPDSRDPIPRISHFVRFTKGSDHRLFKGDFSFNHFLSVLSALHVAGFEHVYMHVDEEPRGRWWEELAKENVTVVKVVRPLTVFQQPVNHIKHVSDVARYMILDKYGGAYQDPDAVWTSYVPDSMLSFPVVAALDWSKKNNWPESINQGVLLAKPRTLWMRHFLRTHRDFRDKDFGFNSLLMSYRTYELYPHLMSLDLRLQTSHQEKHQGTPE